VELHLLGKFSDFRMFQASRAALRMIPFNVEETSYQKLLSENQTNKRAKPTVPNCFFLLCWDLLKFLLILEGGSSLPPNPCSSLDCQPCLHWGWWKQPLLALAS